MRTSALSGTESTGDGAGSTRPEIEHAKAFVSAPVAAAISP
jgi:hypothetical protein